MSKSFDVKKLIFIDESGVQNNMTRLYGRVLGGERLFEFTPGAYWETTTLVSSIRFNGAMECMSIDGAMDADVFRAYVIKVLCPTLKRDEIVIMDNLPVHKVSGIKEAIEAKGARRLYLPPYSPDFNPIEKMWSKLKNILRKMKARSKEELNKALMSAFKEVTASDARGWFESCGYVLMHS